MLHTSMGDGVWHIFFFFKSQQERFNPCCKLFLFHIYGKRLSSLEVQLEASSLLRGSVEGLRVGFWGELLWVWPSITPWGLWPHQVPTAFLSGTGVMTSPTINTVERCEWDLPASELQTCGRNQPTWDWTHDYWVTNTWPGMETILFNKDDDGRFGRWTRKARNSL